MTLGDEKLHAIAALAEAATPHVKHLGVNWIEPNSLAFYEAASPDVVRELVERVIKAEAIVRDLAADDIGVDNDGNCPLCGQYAMGFKETQHAESCPWRRAVDLKL